MESQPPATGTTARNPAEPVHSQPQQPPSSLPASSSSAPPISAPSHPPPIPNPNPNPKPPTPVLPQSRPPPSFSRNPPPPQSHYSHFSSIPPATPQTASSSISSASAPRGGMAIGVPAHHQNPSPPFSSSFGQHFGALGRSDSTSNSNTAQVRTPIQGMGVLGSLGSQFRPMPSQLRPVQSSLRPQPPAQNNQPAGSQSFQGHGIMRQSSVGSPAAPSPSASQSMQSINQPWLSSGPPGKPPLPSQAYRQQLNPQSLQQRTHISQPQQQQSMPTTSQQPQPLPPNQAQEHFGQQGPPSRALHVPHQPQVTRLQGPGNQKPSSLVAAQTNAVQPGSQSRLPNALPNADPEELGKSVLGKRSIHELVNQVSQKPHLTPKKQKPTNPQPQITETDVECLSPNTSKPAKKKKKSKPSKTSKTTKKKKKSKPLETFKPAKKKKKSKPSKTTSQPKPNIIKIKKSKRWAQKVINIDYEPDANAALDHAKSDNSSPGANGPKDDQTGSEYSNIKYVVPRSTNSPLVHPISNKGSNKGSTGEVNQPVEVHQDVRPPAVSPKKSQTSDSESDSKEIEHNNMEIPDTEELNQEQPNDSSPKIPNHGEDGPDDEDEHMSHIFEDPQGEEGPKNDNAQLDVTTGINQPFGTIKGFEAPLTVTYTTLSQEELENLKKKKPAKYLKLMMSTRGSSTDKCSSSSTAFGGQSTVEPADKLLQRIKEKVFDVDLIHVLENDQIACYGIKDLLKQVDILTTPPEVADVIVELGFLIDQVTADLIRKREASTKIQNKTETQTAEWDAATESTNKVEELEKTLQHIQEELNTCASNISNWEQQIKELQANIQKAKERQEEIQKLDRKQLDDEIKVGVHHVERAQNLGIEIATLTSNRLIRWRS